jgi:DNA-binding FrmR family transcriptional regulator
MTVESPTRSAEDLRKSLNRLKRAQGQLAAVIGAMESGADCRAVVTQLAAVSSAIQRAGYTVIASAMKDCMLEPGSDEDRRMNSDELEKLFLTLA